MTIGLFIPCYIDQFYPQAAIATLELLEKLGVDVVYPKQKPVVASQWPTLGMKIQGGR